MKTQKSTVMPWVLILLGMVIVSGCSPVTVEPPVPTPDIAATVEAAVAAALAAQPAPDATATYTAIATEIAVTQPAKAEPAATPTPVPPTATPTAITQAEPVCVSPTIEFTHVPSYGSKGNLQGQVACVEPADYKVAVYIYVDGWYNKPYWAERLTTIQSDGAWTTITPAKYDHLATKIAAFLVPNSYDPPVIKGDQALPEGLSDNAVDHVRVDRPKPDSRTIEFSGYT